MNETKSKPLVLCIMDGWGLDQKSDYNAVEVAQTPNFDYLSKHYPYSTLDASGEAVGLPNDQVGNSEVGHMNLGSGRVVLQTLPKINKAFLDNKIRTNKNFQNFLSKHNKNKTVHLLGLCSDGGVHSHYNHIIGMARLLNENNLKIVLHIFSDGRDCSPKQLGHLIKEFESSLPKSVKIVTLIGRYFSMDRDNRWDRVKKSFDLIAYGKHKRKEADVTTAIRKAYENNETDEFISPTVIGDYKGINEGDSLIMINFRADRVRELLMPFIDSSFNKFSKDVNTPILLNNLGMTEYSTEISKFMESIFKNEEIENTLGEIISNANLKQLRLAETEKYPHVTFFFNGGYEEPFMKEERILCPSPKVATYDLKPEMSAGDVSKNVINEIKKDKFGFICLNFANPDMVGHTGDFKATIKACETVDNYLGEIVNTANKFNYTSIIIADHGNCEKMKNSDGSQNTSHTVNPVPIIIVNSDSKEIENGILADIAPTILDIIGIKKPKEMNGKTLLL